MRRLITILAAVLTVTGIPGLAVAHAEFVSSMPADGETLDEPPAEIVVTFEGELRPDGSGFAVAGPGGELGTGTVDLEVAERSVLRGDVSITEPGIYTVKWTVVGDDGHEQLGDFSFTVSDDEVPVTALAAADGPMRTLPALIGACLLLAALLLLALRRRAT